jgi:hypothetical protein
MAVTKAKKGSSIPEEALAKYESGLFNPIIDKCEGCERIIEVTEAKYCRTYVMPQAKWKNGICNFATHVKPEIITTKVKINPLKASKRAAGKK